MAKHLKCQFDPEIGINIALFNDISNAKELKSKVMNGEIQVAMIKPHLVGISLICRGLNDIFPIIAHL